MGVWPEVGNHRRSRNVASQPAPETSAPAAGTPSLWPRSRPPKSPAPAVAGAPGLRPAISRQPSAVRRDLARPLSHESAAVPLICGMARIPGTAARRWDNHWGRRSEKLDEHDQVRDEDHRQEHHDRDRRSRSHERLLIVAPRASRSVTRPLSSLPRHPAGRSAPRCPGVPRDVRRHSVDRGPKPAGRSCR